MNTEAKVSINRPKQEVWSVITDIENAADNISGIQDVSILEKPSEGIVGLKWSETRIMFGKTAMETMWITDAEEQEYYRTRAESHGAIYTSTLRVHEADGVTELTMSFGAEPVSIGAKLMTATVGRFMMGATRKALQQDLEDIKQAVESRAV